MLNCIPAPGTDSKSEESEQNSEYGNSSDDYDLNNKSGTPNDVDAEDSSPVVNSLLQDLRTFIDHSPPWTLRTSIPNTLVF